MTRPANPIPEGFHTATPYFCSTNADGRIRHAQIKIGDSPIMLSDDYPESSNMRSVQAMGGSPMSVFLSVEDADAAAERAIAAGAQWFHPIEDQEYGRSGGVKDPFGLIWWITAP